MSALRKIIRAEIFMESTNELLRERDIIDLTVAGMRKEIDELLSEKPEQINAQRQESGVSALMAACGAGQLETVLHLLQKKGIDTELIDDFGRDAFDHARPFPRVVAALMRHELPNATWTEDFGSPASEL